MSTLYIIATPIGNLGDISKRALETLESVDLVLAEDTRHTLGLLTHFGIKKPMSSCHKFNELEKSAHILNRAVEQNLSIALVSDAGTPCISDPGSLLTAEAIKRGFEVIAIPGACAAAAALSISGFEIDSYLFVGFLPRDNKERREYLELLNKQAAALIVLYESPKRIMKTLSELNEAFENALFSVSSDLTKLYEKTVRGNYEAVRELLLAGDPEKGEYTVVIKKAPATVDAEQRLSPEAAIVDMMVKSGLSLRDAAAAVQASGSHSRNELYKATLRLGELL